jgi:hypothetical protein
LCTAQQSRRDQGAAEPQPKFFFSASLRVASTQILLFFGRFSLRSSAYLSALCGEIIVTAENAEIRRGTQRRNVWLRLWAADLGALCGEITVTAENAEIRRGTQRRNVWLRLWAADLSALCGEITVTAENAEIRRGTQRKPF